MICNTCKFRETCNVPVQIKGIIKSTMGIGNTYDEDIEYKKRVFEAANSYDKCLEYVKGEPPTIRMEGNTFYL